MTGGMGSGIWESADATIPSVDTNWLAVLLSSWSDPTLNALS